VEGKGGEREREKKKREATTQRSIIKIIYILSDISGKLFRDDVGSPHSRE